MRPLLVVEDDALARKTLERMLRPFAPVVCAAELDGALEVIASCELAGVVTDLGLEDRERAGFDVLDAALRVVPDLPVAVVTGSRESFAANESARRGAVLLAKPDYELPSLMPFIDRVNAREAGVQHRIARVTAAAMRWGLTARERELLTLLVARHSPVQVCDRAGYGRATYKTHITLAPTRREL